MPPGSRTSGGAGEEGGVDAGRIHHPDVLVEIVKQRMEGVARRIILVEVHDQPLARISRISSRGVKWCWKSTIIRAPRGQGQPSLIVIDWAGNRDAAASAPSASPTVARMRNRPSLTNADAQKMMAACKAAAQKNNWNVSIAIVDDGGHLLLLERMDGRCRSARA